MSGIRRTTQASIITGFLAAGGAATPAQAADPRGANPDQASVDGIISSYLGQLGLRDDFQHFLQSQGLQGNPKIVFLDAFFKFTSIEGIPPPSGLPPA